jgi:hypothetical protein
MLTRTLDDFLESRSHGNLRSEPRKNLIGFGAGPAQLSELYSDQGIHGNQSHRMSSM